MITPREFESIEHAVPFSLLKQEIENLNICDYFDKGVALDPDQLLYAFHPKTAEVISIPAKHFNGASRYNDGKIITCLGPVPWSPLYMQPLYDSEEALRDSVIANSI